MWNVSKKERLILGIYLLGFLILVLSIALKQPLADTPPLYGNPPDEHARYLVPKYICEYGKLPIGFEEEVRIKNYGFSYALYNAFPYIVQGISMRFVNLFTDSEIALLYAARLVNVIFGFVMAIVVYLLSKKLFSDRRFQWFFCFAITYLPQNIFIHSYVNSDSCCMLSTAMIVYGLVMIYSDGMDIRNCLWLSGGIILCALSYYNAYGYILSSIILFLAYFIRRNDKKYEWKDMLRWGCFIGSIVILGIGWWFLRSYIVLDGDFLGLQTRKKMAIEYGVAAFNPLTTQSYQKMNYSVWEMIRERETLNVAFCSFIASYGSETIVGPLILYRAYKVFCGAGVMGILFQLCKRICNKNIIFRSAFFHLNMLFCISMPVILMLYYSYTVDYQPQGRYILPSLVPVMYYVVRGIKELSEVKWRNIKISKRVVDAGVCGCVLAILVGTIYMIYFCAMPVYLETGLVLE